MVNLSKVITELKRYDVEDADIEIAITKNAIDIYVNILNDEQIFYKSFTIKSYEKNDNNTLNKAIKLTDDIAKKLKIIRPNIEICTTTAE
jgi:hypothetical protein